MDRMLEIALSNAVNATALAAFAALAGLAIRRPAVLHGVWLVVLLRLLVPPIFELGLLPAADRGTLGIAAVGLDPGASDPPLAGSTSLPAIWTLRGAAMTVWALGAAALLLTMIMRTRRLWRDLAVAGSAPASLTRRLGTLAGQLGLRTVPPVILADAPVPPMLWGRVGAPRLVLPSALIGRLSPPELDALLAHELAHLRRKDHWVRYLELLSVLVFWWHPVSWWARRRLRAAEELCCDELVAASLPGHARAYADCLVKTLRYLRANPGPAFVAASGMAGLTDIEERITMIMTKKTARRLHPLARTGLALAAAATLVVTPTLTARASSGETPYTGDPIDISLRQAPLIEVLGAFAEASALNVVIHPRAAQLGLLDTPVTADLAGTPWDEALDAILVLHGLDRTSHGNVLWIHPLGEGLEGEEEAFDGAPISLSLKKADLEDVLASFSAVADLAIELDPTVEGSVTVELKDVPWDQALDLILRVNGLEAIREGETLRIVPGLSYGAFDPGATLTWQPGDAP